MTQSGNVATSAHRARLRVVRTPRQLEAAVRAAADGAHWLTPTDTADIDLALTIARKIDDAVWFAELRAGATLFKDGPLGDLGSGVVYDVQTLHTILASLGLTPRGRNELHIEAPETDDPLGEVLALY